MHRTLLTKESMVLAIDLIHRCGPSNKIFPQLQSKKTILAVNIAANGVIHAVHY